MDKDKKKSLRNWIIAILVIIVILNIPIVSDVVAMTRAGQIGKIIGIEKIQYDGESHYLFVYDKLPAYEEYSETVAYVADSNIFRTKIRIWEPCTGITAYIVKPLFGHRYQEDTTHFEPGTEPREEKQ